MVNPFKAARPNNTIHFTEKWYFIIQKIEETGKHSKLLKNRTLLYVTTN